MKNIIWNIIFACFHHQFLFCASSFDFINMHHFIRKCGLLDQTNSNSDLIWQAMTVIWIECFFLNPVSSIYIFTLARLHYLCMEIFYRPFGGIEMSPIPHPEKNILNSPQQFISAYIAYLLIRLKEWTLLIIHRHWMAGNNHLF